MSLVENLTRGVIEHVSPVRRQDAVGQVRWVYEQAEREFALAPPLTVDSVDPQLLAAVWAATREALIAGPRRSVKEATAAARSIHGDDAALVRIVAWGAGAASHRVADWIGGTP